ncbi:MAG TPA: hypothetical protein VND24_08465 [Steroidobacteraceae bacterium]|nr:hypothetical protein [Steroidobacteraceae bacterium]
MFVAAPQRESVLDVLRASYPELCEVAKLCAMSRGRAGLDGQDLRLRTPKREYGLKLPLLGRQQLENAATAILAVEQLASAGVMLTADAAHTALSSLRLPGRIEPVKRRPLILVDIAEAPEAMRRLVDTLQNDLGLRRPLVILAAMRQADFPALAAPLAALDPNLILARAPDGGMAEPMNLAQACLDAGLPMPRVEDLTAAVDEALAANPSESACIAGPRAFVATARAYILGLMPPNIHLV